MNSIALLIISAALLNSCQNFGDNHKQPLGEQDILKKSVNFTEIYLSRVAYDAKGNIKLDAKHPRKIVLPCYLGSSCRAVDAAVRCGKVTDFADNQSKASAAYLLEGTDYQVWLDKNFHALNFKAEASVEKMLEKNLKQTIHQISATESGWLVK